MEQFWSALIISLLSSIIGTIIGVLLQKLLSRNDKTNNSPKENVILKYNDIHIQQFSNYYANVSVEVKPQKTVSDTNSTNNDIWVFLIGLIVVSLILIRLFLEYETEILIVLLSSGLFTASMSLSSIYFIKKRKIAIDKKFKSILFSITISTLYIPVAVYFVRNPVFFDEIEKNAILDMIREEGVFAILINSDLEVFGFLLYQVAGVLFLLLFVLHLVLSNLHLLSKINLGLSNKMSYLWRIIYKSTVFCARTRRIFFSWNILLLCFSFTYTSGILARLVSIL
jgi:hypothetical protein